MKTLQSLLCYFLSLCLLVAGATLCVMWFKPHLYTLLIHLFKTRVWVPYGVAVGAGCVLLGLIGLLPLTRRKKGKKTISFAGTHGDVTIELDSVEATLNRMVNKLEEVQKVWVRVTPSEDNRRAYVKADAVIVKRSAGESTSAITQRVVDYLNDTAVNILGVEDVTKVDLNVRKILVDAKLLSKAPEPAAAQGDADAEPEVEPAVERVAPEAAATVAQDAEMEAPVIIGPDTVDASLLDETAPEAEVAVAEAPAPEVEPAAAEAPLTHAWEPVDAEFARVTTPSEATVEPSEPVGSPEAGAASESVAAPVEETSFEALSQNEEKPSAGDSELGFRRLGE